MNIGPMPGRNTFFKTAALTGLALLAFAANSVLCRLALADNSIDPASFTVVRLLSGSIVLLFIISFNRQTAASTAKGDWTAGLMLFLYAISFSYAYTSLGTGVGALVLFGSVQITILLMSIISGERLHVAEWLGAALAFCGFIFLILPGVTTPSIHGFLLMSVAGISWGIYTLKGRNSERPLLDTAYNFFRTTPLVILLGIMTFNSADYTTEGVLLALLSGGITSALGYTIWYIALAGLSTTQAAVTQLSVPVIAAFGGVIFVSEAITYRLTISAALVLGGILMVVAGRDYFSKKH